MIVKGNYNLLAQLFSEFYLKYVQMNQLNMNERKLNYGVTRAGNDHMKENHMKL